MLWLFMLALAFGGPEHIQDTEVFQVLLPQEVFVQNDGEVFLLHFDEACLRHYDKAGRLIGRIGSKGKGPGELTYPTRVQQISGQFYIQDDLTGKVSVFARDGKFIRQIPLPLRPLVARKTQDGWFYYGFNYDRLQGAPSTLVHSDDDFKNARNLAPIASTGWTQTGIGVLSDDSGLKASLTPIPIHPLVAVSPDGSRFYLGDAEKFLISVYDGTTGKRLHELRDGQPRLPFDKDQADAEFVQALHAFRRDHPGTPIQKLYPDHYPALRALTIDPDGNLVVDPWRARPQVFEPVAFNPAGQKTNSRFSWPVLRRLCGVVQDQAFISVFAGEEAAIALVPLAQAERFVREHPITDWNHAYNYFIAN